MKQLNFYKAIFVFTFITLLFSCNEEKHHEFSHDISINSWIIDNREEILNYDRNKIITFSEQKQKAILRFLPAKTKKKIWQSKVDHIMTLKVSKKEKEYLKWFAEIFKEIDFNKTTSRELTSKMYTKVLKAKENFGWSDDFIHDLFFNVGNVVQSSVDDTEDDGADGGIGGGDPRDTCDCKFDWGCGWASDCASNSTCKYNNNDCGFFSNDNCNGTCT